jgi:threonine dehydrogenase-like Zn-dependent dehydrogenase
MHGLLPPVVERFRFAGDTLAREPLAPSAPAAGEVLVAVAGVALGNEPAAEIAGTVVAAGDAAAEWLGRRVVVPRLLPCGDCDRCRRGQLASCAQRRERHGLATHELVPARWLCSVEPPLWPPASDGNEEQLWRLAALADAAAGPWAALARAGVGPGDSVVVVGTHARAQFAAAIAAAKGARVILDDGAAQPIERALVLETRGDAPSRRRALALVGIGGRLALVDGAVPAPPLDTDWSRLVAADAQVVTVTGAHPDLLPELCAMLARRQLLLAPHVRRVDVAAAPAARAAWLAGDEPRLPILAP